MPDYFDKKKKRLCVPLITQSTHLMVGSTGTWVANCKTGRPSLRRRRICELDGLRKVSYLGTASMVGELDLRQQEKLFSLFSVTISRDQPARCKERAKRTKKIYRSVRIRNYHWRSWLAAVGLGTAVGIDIVEVGTQRESAFVDPFYDELYKRKFFTKRPQNLQLVHSVVVCFSPVV